MTTVRRFVNERELAPLRIYFISFSPVLEPLYLIFLTRSLPSTTSNLVTHNPLHRVTTYRSARTFALTRACRRMNVEAPAHPKAEHLMKTLID